MSWLAGAITHNRKPLWLQGYIIPPALNPIQNAARSDRCVTTRHLGLSALNHKPCVLAGGGGGLQLRAVLAPRQREAAERHRVGARLDRVRRLVRDAALPEAAQAALELDVPLCRRTGQGQPILRASLGLERHGRLEGFESVSTICHGVPVL